MDVTYHVIYLIYIYNVYALLSLSLSLSVASIAGPDRQGTDPYAIVARLHESAASGAQHRRVPEDMYLHLHLCIDMYIDR